ncbi:MAG: NAD-dependent epimerase/dehydratase family protein [bacterium]|nr:NAD-dependent epimerase/dehydratase family protein [bacterium]
MKLLVTGGSGFIGSHVAQTLRSRGHEVLTFDFRPPAPGLGIQGVEGDVCDLATLTPAMPGVDVVCHLAGVADVYVALDDPQLAAKVNVLGTANVMQAAREAGISRVVYASTWEVYGAPRYQPVDEGHPCVPDHPYSITKYAGERMALCCGALDGISTIALRLGTAYGSRLRASSVFSVFIQRALHGQSIPVHGDGKQARQFTHAYDLARAFVAAAESDVQTATFNVGAPEMVSVIEIAQMITKHLPAEIEFIPSRKADVVPLRFSSDLARKVLGWTATIPFEEGLRQMLADIVARS